MKIDYRDKHYFSKNYQESPYFLQSDIILQDQPIGSITVGYTEERPKVDIGPFHAEEKKLLDTISKRLSHFLMYKRLKQVFNKWETTKQGISEKKRR
ncbi:MAG: hypothetical protein JXB44_16330 [Calditrichaceae bacterium]|nr:hypothetical protein [Calditrichaceae bacterium]